MRDQPTSIARRRTFLLTGYEPIGPEGHHHRFAREIKRFEKTWSLKAEMGPLEIVEGRPIARWSATVRGPDWVTETDVRLLRWDDLIAEDGARSLIARLGLYGVAALDFVASGTVWRYILTYWRYTLFAIYPAVLLLAFAILSTAIGSAGAILFGKAAWLLAPLVFGALIIWPGRRFHLDYMMNDWIFARDMTRSRRPSIDARAAAMADEIRRGLDDGGVDEVVIIAHSLGAVWMVEAVARALRAHPDLATRGVPLGLCGVGSSILKIALHPSAQWLRQSVKTVADEPNILWAEYDSHVDFVAFYKRNTVETLEIEAKTKPVSRAIRLSRMLAPETWTRFRGNLLRVHRQYVMGNEQRYAYDFHLIACGPFPLAAVVFDGDAVADGLGPDGSLRLATTKPSATGHETPVL
ncbi:MAG: hypothetical protein WCH83_10285 [Alphaproteobacteria bacterium]